MTRDSFDPQSINDALLDALRGKSFRNLAEAQRYLDKQVRAYNSRPQADLAGLSPLQMQQLLSGDWTTTGGFIVNDKVDPAAIGDPDMLHNARAFLSALRGACEGHRNREPLSPVHRQPARPRSLPRRLPRER